MTDPTQKQLEYYHNNKVLIASQRKIAVPKLQSPQIGYQEPKFLSLRKAVSQQEICVYKQHAFMNPNNQNRGNYEQRITLQ
ncbi:unnamed protein product (macronuclear) [Paramecium tetraurelia]|uniref:Uncharacterized protein n=1 Tax=Paramecium tetraurelia TaxID=5888 RepID=A0D3J1_PARTE|nr:uncharacterized protein GSPATT00013096001 [Paramecium tetraurelia]CAK77608.1 unnamed protein product [Paramecium tetraurelia]|eukprot:XP_001445005.1 hypothetical protein (macronuclear) [Paramecium tetraurelia strain d4-2]